MHDLGTLFGDLQVVVLDIDGSLGQRHALLCLSQPLGVRHLDSPRAWSASCETIDLGADRLKANTYLSLFLAKPWL